MSIELIKHIFKTFLSDYLHYRWVSITSLQEIWKIVDLQYNQQYAIFTKNFDPKKYIYIFCKLELWTHITFNLTSEDNVSTKWEQQVCVSSFCSSLWQLQSYERRGVKIKKSILSEWLEESNFNTFIH